MPRPRTTHAPHLRGTTHRTLLLEPHQRTHQPKTPMEGAMTTKPPCDRCDMHGPELPTLEATMIDAHRATHNLWWTLLEPLVPLVNLLIALTQRTPK